MWSLALLVLALFLWLPGALYRSALRALVLILGFAIFLLKCMQFAFAGIRTFPASKTLKVRRMASL